MNTIVLEEIKIISITGYLISIPVNFKFGNSKLLSSNHFIIRIKDESGLEGVGEGVMYKRRHAFFPILAKQTLNKLWPCIVRKMSGSLKHHDFISDMYARLLSIEPSIAFAVDTALWDLVAKINNKPLYELLGGRKKEFPVTEQIFLENPDEMFRKSLKIRARGTKRIKVKIRRDFKDDINLIKKIKNSLIKDTELVVDANQCFNLKEAIKVGHVLEELDIKAFEQPCSKKRKDLETHSKLRRELSIPIMLDESVITLDALEDAIVHEAIDILNLKLTKVGGITQAMKFQEICERYGIGINMGCNEELSLGTSAMLHFASRLKTLFAFEGIGSLRLNFDLALRKVSFWDGFLYVPDGKGLGVVLNDRLLNRESDFAVISKMGDTDFRFLAYGIRNAFQTLLENSLIKVRRKIQMPTTHKLQKISEQID